MLEGYVWHVWFSVIGLFHISFLDQWVAKKESKCHTIFLLISENKNTETLGTNRTLWTIAYRHVATVLLKFPRYCKRYTVKLESTKSLFPCNMCRFLNGSQVLILWCSFYVFKDLGFMKRISYIHHVTYDRMWTCESLIYWFYWTALQLVCRKLED